MSKLVPSLTIMVDFKVRLIRISFFFVFNIIIEVKREAG